jgi:hypothetical protein
MAYDSSSITANADGSVMERQEYLQSVMLVESDEITYSKNTPLYA